MQRKYYPRSIDAQALAISKRFHRGDTVSVKGRAYILYSWDNSNQTVEVATQPNCPLTQTFAFWQLDPLVSPETPAAAPLDGKAQGSQRDGSTGKRTGKSAKEALTPEPGSSDQ